MQDLSFFDKIKVFGFLYLISIGVMYYLSSRNKRPLIIPGDIYSTKPGRSYYIPTGGAFLLSILIYFLIFSVLLKNF